MANLKLYSNWMSSCSFRVRFALNLKGLKYEYVPVNLLKGEQRSPEFLNVNPIGFVPVLVDGDLVLADSFAIILYLDEKYPQHPLFPSDLRRKAINLQVANTISSSIQPLWNLGVMDSIKQEVVQEEIVPWVQYHVRKGFAALEVLLKDHAGRYATGDEVFLADLFLAPQLHSTIKISNLDMTEFPLLSRLNEAYSQLPAYQDALPEKQPDAPSSSTA